MERWTYAVCLGCGWAPKNVRIMHTNPSRVLVGVSAADDDARERRVYASGPDLFDVGASPRSRNARHRPQRRRDHSLPRGEAGRSGLMAYREPSVGSTDASGDPSSVAQLIRTILSSGPNL